MGYAANFRTSPGRFLHFTPWYPQMGGQHALVDSNSFSSVCCAGALLGHVATDSTPSRLLIDRPNTGRHCATGHTEPRNPRSVKTKNTNYPKDLWLSGEYAAGGASPLARLYTGSLTIALVGRLSYTMTSLMERLFKLYFLCIYCFVKKLLYLFIVC